VIVQIEPLLSRVAKAARYTGGEWNSIAKGWQATPVRLLLAYPDVYDIGQSNLGLNILYDLLNREPDVLCERTYAPWPDDMEPAMRESGTPLWSLETRHPLSDFDVVGFSLLGALTTEFNDNPEKACRPFDRERSGFVLGEGAVVVILEEWESARARGATILGEVVGYGSSMNAYRITDAPPDGGGAILAMASALEESGLGKDEVDYIVAHGTGTPGNDLCETVALKQVFGPDAYRLVISSPKSMTGHLTSAAGALNLLAGVCAMRDGIVPPTINYQHPDPKLDLDYVPNTARSMPVRAVMVNAFAFGGTNASLVVRHPEFAGG